LNAVKHGFSSRTSCVLKSNDFNGGFESFFERENWSVSGSPLVVPADDPIRMMDKEGF